MSELEYSKQELEILQKILDFYRSVPEAPLIGLYLRVEESQFGACNNLQSKKVVEINSDEDEEEKKKVFVGVNEKGADEIVRLFKAKILTKYEDRRVAEKG